MSSTTRSRPGSSTRRPRSRTRPSGTTPASTPSGSSRPRSTRARGNERGASTITQQLVRARLLPPSAFEGGRYERKVREIIQSIRLTQEYPGIDGKKADHHRLPQPELLRQPELRDQGRREGLLRDRRPVQGHPRPGGDPGRHPPVADVVRPAQERRAGVLGQDRRGGGLPGRQDPARGPARLPDRRPARPDPDPDAGAPAAAAHQEHVHGRRLRCGARRTGRPQAAGQRQLARSPLRLAGPPPARVDPVRRGARRHLRSRRHRRLQGHHDP